MGEVDRQFALELEVGLAVVTGQQWRAAVIWVLKESIVQSFTLHRPPIGVPE